MTVKPVKELLPFYSEKIQIASFQNIMDDPTYLLRGVALEAGRGDPKMVVMQVMDLELNGGPCPVCCVPFEVRRVDNQHGKFSYYVPGLKCNCFPRCDKVWHRWRDRRTGEWIHRWRPGCGNYKMIETLLGIKFCINCQDHSSEQEANGRMVKPKKKAETGDEKEEVSL